MMRYRGIKQVLHASAESFVKIHPQQFTKEIRLQADILLHHMLLAWNVKEESQLHVS